MSLSQRRGTLGATHLQMWDFHLKVIYHPVSAILTVWWCVGLDQGDMPGTDSHTAPLASVEASSSMSALPPVCSVRCVAVGILGGAWRVPHFITALTSWVSGGPSGGQAAQRHDGCLAGSGSRL